MIRELGFPDRETFTASYERASAWLDGLDFPPERTVIGGFSQGAVMSYALGLGADRPRPAGILALSGFVPTVGGFTLDLERPLPPIAIGHGTYDPVIGVDWGRQARERLEAVGADVLYREYPLPHTIDPGFLAELQHWIQQTFSAGSSAPAASREPS
ncbi:MAG: hypothetical protein H0V11_07705 [Actinobacteria bacterium]|nr:hypothetical protein [Actinomycetota bacterium]